MEGDNVWVCAKERLAKIVQCQLRIRDPAVGSLSRRHELSNIHRNNLDACRFGHAAAGVVDIIIILDITIIPVHILVVLKIRYDDSTITSHGDSHNDGRKKQDGVVV